MNHPSTSLRASSGYEGSQRNSSFSFVDLRVLCGLKILPLDVLPKFRPWIFGIQLCQLSQDFFRTLVASHGDSGLDFDDLISACALFGGRRDALFAQPKLLPRLGSRRNLEHGAAIDGRNLSLGAKRRFA